MIIRYFFSRYPNVIKYKVAAFRAITRSIAELEPIHPKLLCFCPAAYSCTWIN